MRLGAGAAWSSSNAMWPGPRPASECISAIQPFGHDRHRPRIIRRLATCGHGLERSSEDRMLQAGVELLYTSTKFTAKESTSSYELIRYERTLKHDFTIIM